MPPKVPALQREAVEPKLYHIGIKAEYIWAMLRSEAGGALDSRNQQVVFLHSFVQQECVITLSAQTLWSIFDIQASHVRKIHSKAKTRMRLPHRPTALKAIEENMLIRFIQTGPANGNYAIQRDMHNFVEGKFGTCLTYGWIHNFIFRHVDSVCHQLHHQLF
jgi:hypothetical protein